MREIFCRGVESIWSEGVSELERHVSATGLPSTHMDLLREALTAIPELLEALHSLTQDEGASVAARALLPATLSYLLMEDDLFPSRSGQLILGLADEAYLFHAVFLNVPEAASRVDLERIQRRSDALCDLLPVDVRTQLDRLIQDTLTSTAAEVERLAL